MAIFGPRFADGQTVDIDGLALRLRVSDRAKRISLRFDKARREDFDRGIDADVGFDVMLQLVRRRLLVGFRGNLGLDFDTHRQVIEMTAPR